MLLSKTVQTVFLSQLTQFEHINSKQLLKVKREYNVQRQFQP